MIFLATSCSTLNNMNDNLNHSNCAIEENTQMVKQSGSMIEENTKEIRQSGHVIAENTRAIIGCTYPMRFILPAFCASLFLFNYVFFRKILKRLKKNKGA